MKKKHQNKNKQSQKMTRRERNEHLCNWYMINFCWGLVGILGLTLIHYGYRNPNTLLAMQPLVWILTGVFALGALLLFVLGKAHVIANTDRANHYAIFSGVCALVSLWLALYTKIRPLLERVARVILSRPNLTVNSYWNVWIPMIGIVIYLVGAFIYFAVKVTRK